MMNEVDGMRQEDSKDLVMHNGKSAICDFERKMRVDERW